MTFIFALYTYYTMFSHIYKYIYIYVYIRLSVPSCPSRRRRRPSSVRPVVSRRRSLSSSSVHLSRGRLRPSSIYPSHRPSNYHLHDVDASNPLESMNIIKWGKDTWVTQGREGRLLLRGLGLGGP